MPPVASPSLRRLWLIAILTSAVGIALSIELTLVHARVHTNPATRSFCTLSEHISCDRTAQSGYSLLAGVPLSLWGVLAYALLLVLGAWGWRSLKPLAVAPFSIIASACAAGSVVLAYISGVLLRNLCLLCLATWLVDWTLFGIACKLVARIGIAELRRQVRQVWRSRRTVVLATFAGIGCAILGMRLVVPDAWGKGRVSRVVPGTKLMDNAKRLSPSVHLPSGVDDAGHPYIGSATPRLSITEFADYQCPHCANAHVEMRELVAKNPQAIRIVHRHFPLDNQCNPMVQRPFHTRACGYAHLAACALLAGKFWDANDYLFDHGRDVVPVTAESLGKAIGVDATQLRDCASKAGTDIVKQDIEEGLRLKIEGTPSFLVDGKVYKGQLPEAMLAPYE